MDYITLGGRGWQLSGIGLGAPATMRLLHLMAIVALVPGEILPARAQSVVLNERDAVVWAQEQVVRGEIADGQAEGILYMNGHAVRFSASGGVFSLPVRLSEGENELVACASDGSACSDTLRWTLGFALQPEALGYATVTGEEVRLRARVLANPDSSALTFAWSADASNPAPVSISQPADSVTSLTLPGGHPPGEYYFDLLIEDAAGKSSRSRTFVTVTLEGVVPFDIKSDHAAWVDRAVVYEVTPYIFNANGKFRDITARLPELDEFGINTLWVQPIFGTHGRGQGYDITDYFAVRPDLGTEEELRTLVDEAHRLGMRVLFDFPPNHTAIQHPYAQEAIEHGPASHYYGFYQREPDNVRYSRHYNLRQEGKMQFIYYFWQDLVNLDYNNPEVQRWIIEAGRYWIEAFDIDGYRIDAVWGTNARTPEAMQNWRMALKQIKPEIFLLGEDKATVSASFENRFDAAFDWFPGEGWVSEWTWQTDFSTTSNPTIFNYRNESSRSRLLREALTNRGAGFHPDAKVLRFMENNDTFRFLKTHEPRGVERTKMAAALLFSLHGIPLIYNGQEIGASRHPYNTFKIFDRSIPIRDQDAYGLYPHYQRLIELRESYAALYSDNYQEVAVAPDQVANYVFAFRRWDGDENLFSVVNMGARAATATLSVPVEELDVDAARTYYLTDLITGDYFSTTGEALASVEIPVRSYTTRVLVLADHVVEVPTSAAAAAELPEEALLYQNYPNPFVRSTSIAFTLPRTGDVRLSVYDVLGREIAVLDDRLRPAGRHEAVVDADFLAAGVYFARLTFEGQSQTMRMVLSR